MSPSVFFGTNGFFYLEQYTHKIKSTTGSGFSDQVNIFILFFFYVFIAIALEYKWYKNNFVHNRPKLVILCTR